jgi:diaminopimelate epimerase
MNFTKLQAAGNDFILVETSDIQRNWAPVAMAMCDRHFGVGADGLLLLLPSDRADFQMRIFNPDGSEAEACGNGLTCLVKYVLNRGLAHSEAQEILIETMAGIRKTKINRVKGKLAKIQVSMGTPKFAARDIPVAIEEGKRGLVDIKSMLSYTITIENRELSLNFVSIGNPHAVYFCQQPVSDFPLSQIGSRIEHLPIFPNRINFEVANVMNRQLIEARVWERGVGETLACGSGACAVAVAAQLRGYSDNKVEVKLPGGILEVGWYRVGEIFLSASAEIVFTGEWPEGG